MINAKGIFEKAERKYTSFLKSIIEETSLFPWEVRADKKPCTTLHELKLQIDDLIQKEKSRKGFGYTVEFKKTKTKTLGVQNLPEKIVFETERDYVKFLRKESDVKSFKEKSAKTIDRFPELRQWLLKDPKKLIDHLLDWDDILKVCQFFKTTPYPNCYIRELPIKVNTKFVEKRQSILKSLLNVILGDLVNENGKSFEERFHLKVEPKIVRFAILDTQISTQYFMGIDDLSIPVDHFNQLKLPIKRVIIVENQTNIYTTLTLPLQPHTIAIFGRGFDVITLKHTQWLKHVEILYWGDIDAHGFAILSQVKGYFPQTKSILMDSTTFDLFYDGIIGAESSVQADLNLNPAETILYKRVAADDLRLEQEKIPLDYVKEQFAQISDIS